MPLLELADYLERVGAERYSLLPSPALWAASYIHELELELTWNGYVIRSEEYEGYAALSKVFDVTLNEAKNLFGGPVGIDAAIKRLRDFVR